MKHRPTVVYIRYFIKKFSFLIPAKLFILVRYRLEMGYWMNLSLPVTFNEKLQWLKLFDRNPAYTLLVDKYEVKKYVSKLLGEEYVIPTIGIWKNANEIDFSQLPNQFVLKCTHDSGTIIICKDKNKLNIPEVRRKLNRCIKINYYHEGKEWPYKNVKPRIIAEPYLEDSVTKELRDYKFFCFNGSPYLIQCDYGRFINHKRNVYDLNWQFMNIQIHYPFDSSVLIERPISLNKMIDSACILSKNIPFARIDFYEVNGKMFFGEITFYHGSGYERFFPSSWDKILGDMISLPLNK